MNTKKWLFVAAASAVLLLGCGVTSKVETAAKFPSQMPAECPEGKLSSAMSRTYDKYDGVLTLKDNELYTQFKYSNVEGFDYNNHDGSISRREATRIIKANGKYYMWYNLRQTPPVGTAKGGAYSDDMIPNADYDLSDIAYATSTDGFTWEEQGIALKRPAKPAPGSRTFSTPDILVFDGRYYLFYQVSPKGKNSAIAVSWADSPDGPWIDAGSDIFHYGEEGAWDHKGMHNPQPMYYKGKVYLYYKAEASTNLTGLAIADHPLGPYTRCELNPVMNSGHKSQMFRFKGGIAAMSIQDGVEANTIQYAEDGVNFEVMSTCGFMPIGAGVYDPDAFTDTENASGITWGISHISKWGAQQHCYFMRFDCDLSLEHNDPVMKQSFGQQYSQEELLRHGISAKQRKAAIEQAARDLREE